MTRLEEARINAEWAAGMLAKGNFHGGLYPDLVEQMLDEFSGIISEEEAKDDQPKEVEQ